MATMLPELFSWSPFVDPTPGTPDYERDRFTPVLAVHESPTEYAIEMELPFAKRGDVDVRVHGHDVVIRCRHAIDQHEAARTPRRASAMTPTFGSCAMRIHLARAIEPHVATHMRGGVLEVVAHKA